MESNHKIEYQRLAELAGSLGLDIIGVTRAGPISEAGTRLKIWQEKGLAADMAYMKRDPDLLSNPLKLLPEARSVISVAVRYSSNARTDLIAGHGRVARYAWGRDYHIVLPERIARLVGLLRSEYGDFKFRIFSDAVPLLERAFAASSGLGFIGKNTLLIRPGLGSFTLLAEILSELEVVNSPVDKIPLGRCGTCRRCLDSCPTAAFESEYLLNAGRCISYLSIEKRGALNEQERSMLGEWIFGCDICQEVCPFNHTVQKQDLQPQFDEFDAKYGAGAQLRLEEVFLLKNQEEFRARFRDSPLLRPKRAGLIRNAVCVAVNTAYFPAISSLRRLSVEDSEPLVRQFSFWGLASLWKMEEGSLRTEKLSFIERGLKDPDLQIQDEINKILSANMN